MKSVLAWCAALGLAVSGTQANAAWYEAKSKHFIIYSEESPKDLQARAEKLERFDQAVRYVRRMPDPDLTDAGRVTIFVVFDFDAITRVLGSEGIGGEYMQRASGEYAFVPQRSQFIVQGESGGIGTYEENLKPQQIFFHEYTHHLQLQDATVAIPQWVSEGMAEFFATAEVQKDGSVAIGKFPAYRSFGLHDRDSLPLEQMVGETYKIEKINGWQFLSIYSRGWLLFHYLTMSDQRKGQFTKYIAGIQKGMTPLDSAKAAFGDLGQLDRDMYAYFAPHQLPGFTVDAGVIPIGLVAVRPLSAGEAAIINVRMRSKRGVDDEDDNGMEARDIARDARGVAANFPNDPDVQSALAEAEYDAKNYAAAESAADRALAARPNDVQALIYKGHALMAQGRASPKTANWDGIRSWFSKANKLDTENAEPLELFYQSYVYAGERPTKDAADALLYAVDLAPQDGALRLTAVGLLIWQNRLDDAKAMLGPIAHNPDLAKEWRELASKLMTAITADDAKTALALLADTDDGKPRPAKKIARGQ